MQKISTLIFLVNKIRSEVTNRSFKGFYENENYLIDNQEQDSPPESAVNALLNYARSLEVSKSKAIGDLEWVLN